MLQFDEYKVKLNNLRPELDELDQAGVAHHHLAQLIESVAATVLRET